MENINRLSKIVPKNKRGQLGLDTVKTVMLAFLILAVISVAIILAMTSLRDATEKINKVNTGADNETVGPLSSATATDLAFVQSGTFRNSVCSGHLVTNGTAGSRVLTAANYTLSKSGCAMTLSSIDNVFNLTVLNVTYVVIYSDPSTNDIANNMSSALVDFFSNTSTIFAILIVVVIILAIAIIIAVVTRFGEGGSSGITGGFGKGGKSEGAGTVMGI